MKIDGEINAENILFLRKSLKLGQVDFGALIGVQKRSISDWENGRGHPTSSSRRVLRSLMQQNGMIEKTETPAIKEATPESIKHVNPSKIKTVEQYACSILLATISVKTLQGFCVSGVNTGALSEDEIEVAKTITWELRRLLDLYNKHLEEILERVEVSKEDILASLKTINFGEMK
jgi:transcriptional regulator with XRE-family HTH domain